MGDKNYILEFQSKIFEDTLDIDIDWKINILKKEGEIFKKMLKSYNLASEGDVVLAITSNNYNNKGEKYFHGRDSLLVKGEKYIVKKIYKRNNELNFYYIAAHIDGDGREELNPIKFIRIHPDSVRKNDGIRFLDIPFLENSSEPKSYKKIDSGVIYIYGLEGREDGYKIGYSSQIKKRIQNAQTHNLDNVVLISEFPTNSMREDEKKIKKELEKHHIRGEWYGSECKEIIKKIMT